MGKRRVRPKGGEAPQTADGRPARPDDDRAAQPDNSRAAQPDNSRAAQPDNRRAARPDDGWGARPGDGAPDRHGAETPQAPVLENDKSWPLLERSSAAFGPTPPVWPEATAAAAGVRRARPPEADSPAWDWIELTPEPGPAGPQARATGRTGDRWPPLPDDRTLWQAPVSAFAEAHVQRLDDEQRGF